MLANRVKGDAHPDYVTIANEAAQASNARATIIDRQGHVLADSQANPAEMENHATRPEFARALNGEIGEDSRSSHTVGVEFLYVAAPIPNGAVRLAYPLASVEAVRKQVWMKLLWGSLLGIVVATILAGIAAQGISRRLKAIVSFAHHVAEGDLTARIDERRSSDEIAAVATALDKTARRLQESFAALETSHEELEAVLNSMQEAVIAVSADGRALWANRKMNELAPPGVRLNAPVVETVRDPDFLRAIEHAAQEKEVQTTRVNWIAVRRAFSVTAAPMPNGGAVAVLFDLSEVERLEKTRRDFIANVSHELRTPLTSIQGYTETLLDAPPGDASMTHEFLEIIRKNAARMARLTEDLLTLARVESGEQNFRFHPVPANTLLQNAYETFVEVARSRDVELTIESNTEELVQADEDAIQQVFANLIDNAIKYSSAGAQVFPGSAEGRFHTGVLCSRYGPGDPFRTFAAIVRKVLSSGQGALEGIRWNRVGIGDCEAHYSRARRKRAGGKPVGIRIGVFVQAASGGAWSGGGGDPECAGIEELSISSGTAPLKPKEGLNGPTAAEVGCPT